MTATEPGFHPSLPHRLWRWLPAVPRRRALARVSALLAPRPAAAPPAAAPGVAIAGALSSPSGLGEAARLMIRAVRALGVRVWAIDIPPPTLWPAGRRTPAIIPPAGVPLILHVNAPVLPLALLRLPGAVVRDRRIIGCWAWELPVVPPEWRAAAGLVHEVWAPSRFAAAALEPLMPHRVHVVPPALALAPPRGSGKDRAAFGLPEAAVVTLVSFNLASSFQRKNPLGAIAAFQRAFGARGDRVLVIKVCHADHAPDDFAHLRAAAAMPNIRLISGALSGADRHALTACADIVLSLHRAEGFGLVPAEAMLLGRPVVATGWSGNLDYMTEDTAELVDFRLVRARDRRGVYRGADWAEPDLDDAASRLRRLADEPRERARLGEAGRIAALHRLNGEGLRVALRSLGVPVPSGVAGAASPPGHAAMPERAPALAP